MDSPEFPSRSGPRPPGQADDPGVPVTGPLVPHDIVLTPLSRRPLMLMLQSRGTVQFESATRALIQFMPSGVCYLFDLAKPIIFGRAYLKQGQVIDLSDLKALQHGVSRWHCMLRRSGTTLLLRDLGSTNGTYLNGWRLVSNQDYVLADGDRVILGTLHCSVFFQTP